MSYRPRYPSHFYRKSRVGISAVAILSVLVLLAVGCSTALLASKEPRTFTLQHIERGSDDKPALAFTDVGVFSIEDSLFLWHFNSSDIYGELVRQEDKRMTCTVAGWRIRFLSMWENILECEA